MTLKEIEQAIEKLSPAELARFREWFREFEARQRIGSTPPDPGMRERIRKLRGSLKGTGVMEAFMRERHKGRV